MKTKHFLFLALLIILLIPGSSCLAQHHQRELINRKPILPDMLKNNPEIGMHAYRERTPDKHLKSYNWAKDIEVVEKYDVKLDSITSENYAVFVKDLNDFNKVSPPKTRSYYQYAENGNTISEIVEEWDYTIDQWVNSIKDVFGYDDRGNIIEEISSDWDNATNQWIPQYKFDDDYNNDGRLFLEISYKWDEITSTWINYYKYETTYDAIANREYTIEYAWDILLNQWLNVIDWEIYYNDDQTFNYINFYEWNELTDQWVWTSRNNYGYDVEGNNIYISYSFWDDIGGQMVEYYYEQMTYDSRGNQLTCITQEWNEATLKWDNKYKYENIYDDYDNQLQSTYYLWDDISSMWVPDSKNQRIFYTAYALEDVLFPAEFENEGLIHSLITEQIGYLWIADAWLGVWYSQYSYSDAYCTPETETDSENILDNGDFGSCSLSPWTFYYHDYLGVLAKVMVNDGACTVYGIISTDDPLSWHIQLFQELSAAQLDQLEMNAVYTLSFDAIAETENRPFTVVIGQNESPYTSIYEQEYTAGTLTKSFSVDFSLTEKFSRMKLSFDVGKETSPISFDNVKLKKKNIVHSVPAIIQAEDFNAMMGIQTEITTDAGGGMNVGYTDAGDWMDYLIDVPVSGLYTIYYRVAGTSDGQISFAQNGVVLSTTNILSTGGWQTWTTDTTTVYLTQGISRIRLNIVSGGWNINWWSVDVGMPVPYESVCINNILIYPNPATEQLNIVAEKGSIVRLYNCQGILVKEASLTDSRVQLDVAGLSKGIYLVEISNRRNCTVEKVIIQ